MAEVFELRPLPLADALGLAPIPAVMDLRVEVAALRAVIGVAGTHGAAGLGEALADVLGHRLDPTPGSAGGPEPRSLWTGPDRWLVVSEHLDRFDLARRIRAAAPRATLVTDLTDGLPAIDLIGPGAWELLAHGCPAVPADGQVARTLLALQPVTLLADADRVRLFTDRGLVPFLWDWLARHAPLAAA
ncbi:aminomethyltransferase family protein [Geminicoccus flavidas]|uniref:hypothetical protein n=1 Tax=Geminicoccus flavidas TaxID=2506407 RepID=UPI00135B2174|nr:hypothetical protein [Geminicoccus flavidas]